MKFSMVMIICFATGVCETLFDSTQYDTYDQCIEAANSTVLYMQKTFPMSLMWSLCSRSQATVAVLVKCHTS